MSIAWNFVMSFLYYSYCCLCFSLFFLKPRPPCYKMWLSCYSFKVAWLYKPYSCNMPCMKNIILLRLHKFFCFKSNQKPVVLLVQEDHHKLSHDWLFQIFEKKLNILSINIWISCEDESWTKGINFPTFVTYILGEFLTVGAL